MGSCRARGLGRGRACASEFGRGAGGAPVWDLVRWLCVQPLRVEGLQPGLQGGGFVRSTQADAPRIEGQRQSRLRPMQVLVAFFGLLLSVLGSRVRRKVTCPPLPRRPTAPLTLRAPHTTGLRPTGTPSAFLRRRQQLRLHESRRFRSRNSRNPSQFRRAASCPGRRRPDPSTRPYSASSNRRSLRHTGLLFDPGHAACCRAAMARGSDDCAALRLPERPTRGR